MSISTNIKEGYESNFKAYCKCIPDEISSMFTAYEEFANMPIDEIRAYSKKATKTCTKYFINH